MPSRKLVEGLVGAHLTKQQYKALDDSLDLYVRKALAAARRNAIRRNGGGDGAISISIDDMRAAVATVLGVR